MLAATPETKSNQIKNLLSTLILLQNHLRLYDPGNRIVGLTSERLLDQLQQLLAAEDPLTLYVGRHAFIHDDQFIERSSRLFADFANRLFQHGIAAISFKRGLDGGQLQAFLRLVDRKPADSWDEGGIDAALRLRNVNAISVQEMSELDFSLDEETADDAAASPLWLRFIRSIIHGLHADTTAGEVDDLSASALAAAVNRQLQQAGPGTEELFARDLSRFLLSLKHENIRIYRTATLTSLVAFVNDLTPRMRELFLRNVFNLNIDQELSEGLLRGLTDQAIMEALHNAALDPGYAPPLVLRLLGRLAAERGLSVPETVTTAADKDGQSDRIAELFREDDLDRFVPSKYQSALLAIIRNRELPETVSENLARLKETLEHHAVERHLGEILLQVLNGPLEPEEIGLLKNNLRQTLGFYLATHDFARIKELLKTCRQERLWQSVAADIYDFLADSRFSATLLDNLGSLEHENGEAAKELIAAIGTPFIAPLLDRLGTESNRTLRRLYLTLLARLGDHCIPQIVSRLTDNRWFVVRNMIYLLRELGNPEVLPQVRPQINHPHPKVSQEALKTCLVFHDQEVVPFLLALLRSENEAQLLQAVSQAAFCNDTAVYNRLLELLHERSVLNFRLEVKRAVVRSLAAVDARRSLPVFAEILNSHNLFHQKQLQQLQLEVIAALERIPGTESGRLLSEQALNGTTELRQAARAALTRSRGGKP